MIVATPVNLGRVIQLAKPSVRVHYEVVERSDLTLDEVIRGFVAQYSSSPAPAGTPSSD